MGQWLRRRPGATALVLVLLVVGCAYISLLSGDIAGRDREITALSGKLSRAAEQLATSQHQNETLTSQVNVAVAERDQARRDYNSEQQLRQKQDATRIALCQQAIGSLNDFWYGYYRQVLANLALSAAGANVTTDNTVPSSVKVAIQNCVGGNI